MPDLDDARRGQGNGVLGAAVPGCLAFVTGTHTGRVPVRCEWHEEVPDVEASWKDVVEVPFEVIDPDGLLSAFEECHSITFPTNGWHRARLCALGMDAAREDLLEDDAPPDRYLLQLWPATRGPERILRSGSRFAEHAHEEARGLPGKSDAERAADRRAQEQFEWESSEEQWATPPWELAKRTPEENALDELPNRVKIRARWLLARHACLHAGIADDPRVVEALSRLEQSIPPSPGYTDAHTALALLGAADGSSAAEAVRAIVAATGVASLESMGSVLNYAAAASRQSQAEIAAHVMKQLDVG